MMNDVKFEFIGFHPDDNIRNLIAAVAEKLHFHAPSDSAIKLVFKKTKNVLHASCRIGSQAGTFLADAVCENPVQGIRLVEAKIKSQLDQWKRKRFKMKSSVHDILD